MAIWVSGARSASAQQAAAGDEIAARLVVTVEPHHGSEAPVINREDVMVYEGKERDKVIEWIPAQGEEAALELFVLLDDGSNTTLGTQLEDIRKFILAQPATAKIGVAYMQNGVARVEQNLTTDHAQAAKALRLPMGISGANGSPYFSLSDLIKRWPETTARREIFMASDGIDRYYGTGDLLDPYLDEAIGDAQRAGIVVSAIYTPGVGHFGHSYWRTYWGQLYLAQLADRTGGEAYYIGFNGPPVTFAPYLDDLTQRLNRQYFLTFLAKPPKKAGLQEVKLRTEVHNADLVSADRVYVPAAR
ncbi:MAG TPA: hypothetical protein VKR60_14640 [Candidatus Sulfotelmatobacter sp.]|nr:hypothetical protein [Candidatus Sulfotelmatobacter sp.]